MFRWMYGFLFACTFAACASEPAAPPATTPSIRVECHGKLRTGMMAMGGETTGTTVSASGLIWELKLPDDASCRFAKDRHKKPVTVVGTLRRVTGTERPVRWIVDVTRISDRDDQAVPEKLTVALTGSIQKNASPDDGLSGFQIKTDDTIWPLELPAGSELSTKLDSLLSKTVNLTGKVERIEGKELPPRMKIIVNKIDPRLVSSSSRRTTR